MPYVRALLRYFVITAAIIGLAWASITVQYEGRSVAAHLRDRGKVWFAELMEAAQPKPEPAKDNATAKKKAPAKKRAGKKATAKAAPKKDTRPPREVPPEELQSEPEAEARVNLLADAARRAKARVEGDSKPEPTRITPQQKKALDALLTSRQSP